MKIYYIVKVKSGYSTTWVAYGGLFARMGYFGYLNYVSGAMSDKSADECEQQLRREVSPHKYEVVRVVKI